MDDAVPFGPAGADSSDVAVGCSALTGGGVPDEVRARREGFVSEPDLDAHTTHERGGGGDELHDPYWCEPGRGGCVWRRATLTGAALHVELPRLSLPARFGLV